MTLSSKQYTQFIDLISEGEIQGLVDGEQSIYLDNTPYKDANGNANFEGITVYTRNGTKNQDVIELGDRTEEERNVGVVVQKDFPVTRTITDNDVDAVRITLSFPALATSSGTKPATVEYQIAVRYSGGSYTTVVDQTNGGKVSGQSAQEYARDHEIKLTGAFPVDIKVTRITADATAASTNNAFSWASYSKIVYGRFRYPNAALVGIRLDSEQFNAVPRRSYRVRGIKIKIPDNATVDSNTGRLIYSGVWTGTFHATKYWCSDPAWILYDLLISSRYGFGDHIAESRLDKFSFYEASVYASALVPDGFGGTEPRFSCNVNIQTEEDAYKLINNLCSVFRAMPYWTAGSLSIAHDAPSDPVYLFTPANVTTQGFSYSGSSLKGRPTVALVSYLDLDIRDIAKEVVEDRDGITRYGVITTEIDAFGCTSRGQARRVGEWLLYVNRYEGEVVNFVTSIDAGVVIRPGDVIAISDPVRSEQRYGGRITSATTTAITVDSATGLTLGTSPQLSVVLPDGTVETKTVSSIVGNVFTVSSAYSVAPNSNSIWVYEVAGEVASTWRVIGITESDQNLYSINATAYEVGKYDVVERDQPLVRRDITNLNELPSAPTNLSATEELYEANGVILSKLTVSWTPTSGVDRYRIRWRLQDGNWEETEQSGVGYEIPNTVLGNYELEVYSISSTNLRSSVAANLTVTVYGKTAVPATPTNMSLAAIDEASAVLSWDRSTELDVILNGKVLIRHQPVLAGASWENAQEIVPAAAGGQTQKQVPLLEGTYLIKFEDDGGRRSSSAASVIVDLPTPQARLLVQEYTDPPFTGTAADMFYDAETNALVLGNDIYVDDMAQDGDWDALDSIDNIGGTVESGSYTMTDTLDLNGVFDVNMRRILEFTTYAPGDLWDDNEAEIDTWQLIDGISDRVNAAMYVRSTDDDPAGTPTWGDWREASNVTVRGRGHQFKLVATSQDATQSIRVTDLGMTVEMQQRVERSDVHDTLNTAAEIQAGRDYTIVSTGTTDFTLIGAANNNVGTKFTATGPGTGTGTVAGPFLITFVDPFYQSPAMGITIFNAESGDYFTLDTLSRTGVDLVILDKNDKPAVRDFQYTATGYGKEII